MSFVSLGVVSNVWTHDLPGSSLEEQCRRAGAEGFEYVELRQGALGACEERVSGDGPPWPLPEALAGVRRAVPDLRMNLAVEAPFLTRPVSADDPYLVRCAEAALALGGDAPVLRLVDLSPADRLLDEDAVERLGRSVEGLARSLWGRGVCLALENSKQPLSALRAVIRRAALALPEDRCVPRICWDLANQAQQHLGPEDPLTSARTLPVEELFMFHFKQLRQGAVLPDVREGDLDWKAALAALRSRGYEGPALFEIPPGPDAWERLAGSADYIRSLLRDIETRSA